MRIKVDDTVQVMAGDDIGQRGKVLRVDRRTQKLVVEGVNRVYKHVRRSQRNPQGGRLSKEMPIQASNVMLVCDRCGAVTRVGLRYAKDGSKSRYCKKCGADLGQVAPPHTSRATGS
jgi:large subunit ribosomal protein L24